MSFNEPRHIYQVIRHCDGSSKVVFETENKHEAYYECDKLNHFNTEFTYSYYEVDC